MLVCKSRQLTSAGGLSKEGQHMDVYRVNGVQNILRAASFLCKRVISQNRSFNKVQVSTDLVSVSQFAHSDRNV